MSEINLLDYRKDIECLLSYIPWFEQKVGQNTFKMYDGDGLQKSTMSFPVYESTLLNFVNDVSATKLIDRNYAYVYSGRFIKTVEDEKKAIEDATIKDGKVLCGILSKYVLGGMTKGTVWTEGVENGIFLDILKKMKSLVAIWDAPLA